MCATSDVRAGTAKLIGERKPFVLRAERDKWMYVMVLHHACCRRKECLGGLHRPPISYALYRHLLCPLLADGQHKDEMQNQCNPMFVYHAACWACCTYFVF